MGLSERAGGRRAAFGTDLIKKTQIFLIILPATAGAGPAAGSLATAHPADKELCGEGQSEPPRLALRRCYQPCPSPAETGGSQGGSCRHSPRPHCLHRRTSLPILGAPPPPPRSVPGLRAPARCSHPLPRSRGPALACLLPPPSMGQRLGRPAWVFLELAVSAQL